MAHIPDGFLSAPVAAGTLAAAAAVTAYAARKAGAEVDERQAPTLGLATAAIFAAQAINFPVAAGTSGHLMGGVMAAVVFGPRAGFLVMTAVLLAQALLFADGGITALGANILNIAALGALGGYALYRAALAALGVGPRRRAFAAGLAALVASVATGAAAGAEIGVSGVAPIGLAVGAMASVHLLVGIVEGTVTGVALWALSERRPDLLRRDLDATHRSPGRAAVLATLGAIAVLAGGLSIVASAAPDGLERVAVDLGFAELATSWGEAPLAGYRAWLSGGAGTALAIVMGVLLLFAGVAALARASARARPSRER